MVPVLYCHGFASSPLSAKVTSLRPLLESEGIELIVPDLNVPSFERLDFDAVVAHAVACGRATPPRAMAGSSLGALVALATARRIAVPLVLIAPALGVVRHWPGHIPASDPVAVFNHARGAEMMIHRAFFDRMATLDVDDEPPPSRVTVIMGRRDESVPFAMVEERWRTWKSSGCLVAGSRFVDLPEGDHSLAGYASVIRDAIVEAVG